jgi:hypothetical protein
MPTFTLNGSVSSATITTPIAHADTIVFKIGAIPAGYTIRVSGYYFPTYQACNVLVFNSNTNTNWYNDLYIFAAPTTCTLVMIEPNLTEIDLVGYDNTGTAVSYWTILPNVVTTNNIDLLNDNIALISPNPSKDNIYVNLHKQINTPIIVNLFNSFGQLILTESYFQEDERKKINIEKLSSGIYSLEVIYDDKRNIQKIIKI